MRALPLAMVGLAFLAGTQGAYAVCVGDCNNNGKVVVNELVTGVNIALDRDQLTSCPSFDSSGNGKVEVNELVTGVNNALHDSCPAVVDTPTPTATTSVAVSSPTPTTTTGPKSTSQCTFTEADSSLALCFLGICAPGIAISGDLSIQCAAGGGSRECDCIFHTFQPVNITGVGYACVEEATGTECPAGIQDCGGTTSVNIDLVADTSLGSCSGNAECRTKCDAYCAALDPPKTRFSSGCESFCQSGTRIDQPCECDVLGAATCNANSTKDCPSGSCEGKDNEADIDCHCQCNTESFGNPSPAGSMRCRLPTSIRVESSLPCDNNGVLVRLPPLCAPFTTGTSSGILLHTNETADPQEFPDLMGAATTCAALDAGNASGMTLVANLPFFDSTIGDIVSQLTVKCQ